MTKRKNVLTQVEARHHINSLYREVFEIEKDNGFVFMLRNKANGVGMWWQYSERAGGFRKDHLAHSIDRTPRCLEVSL